MRDDREELDGVDGGPIETFDHAAVTINALVIQGRIGATNPADAEALLLLNHPSSMVEAHEDAVRQGLHDSALN